MENGTINEGIQVILHEQSIPLWVRILALFGAIYLVHTVTKTCFDVFKAGAYIIGTVKFAYQKIKKKQ